MIKTRLHFYILPPIIKLTLIYVYVYNISLNLLYHKLRSLSIIIIIFDKLLSFMIGYYH